MGHGAWTIDSYTTRASTKAAAGKSTFDYDDDIRAGRASKVNALLDPKATAGALSPHAGTIMREVMISDEHPNPTPIAIVLDVTGSNIDAARVVHGKLPGLHGLLQRKGYCEDPQINMCATGDANSDRFPVQVGQFESDNRIDAQLEAMILEGNGGGGGNETYELLAYFLARHTFLEPFEEQGRKGYAFFIGDEMPYDKVRKGQVASLIGDSLEDDVSTAQIFTELQERYEVFFLFQAQGSYRESQVLPAWRKLLGERALVLDDPAAVCEFIAGVLGMLEGDLDLDEIEEDLLAVGSASTVKAATKALAVVGGGRSAAAKVDGSLPDPGTSSGTSRI